MESLSLFQQTSLKGCLNFSITLGETCVFSVQRQTIIPVVSLHQISLYKNKLLAQANRNDFLESVRKTVPMLEGL